MLNEGMYMTFVEAIPILGPEAPNPTAKVRCTAREVQTIAVGGPAIKPRKRDST